MLVLVLLVLAAAARLVTERLPSVRVQRLLASTVSIRGPRPKLAWPTEGESAIDVVGIGGLGRHGPDTPVPIASVAKVMTAYLTLREHPLASGSEGFEMTITQAEVEEERSRAALDESVTPVATGERLSERQALEALLLPSANNVAALLAVHDAGSQAAFVARMNATARHLGMRSTRYTDPSGYEDSTVSTATDLLELAAAAMREPGFAQLVNERSARLPVAGRVTNYNGLVGEEGYVGIKTGSDSQAGGCLLFAKRVTVAGRRFTLLGVVLGQRAGPLIPAALTAARRLGNSAAAALRKGVVLPAGARVLVAHGVDGDRTSVVTKRPLRQIGWGGLRIHVKVSIERSRSAKLTAGENVATVSVDGASSSSSGAVASRSLPSPSLAWRLSHVL
jgi:D-alanyl-D-alanine carboxypeptidase (penicillin-binding protein 5/6)